VTYELAISESLLALATKTPILTNIFQKDLVSQFPLGFLCQLVLQEYRVGLSDTSFCHATTYQRGICCHRASVCPSVCLSVTSRSSTITAKHMITQTTLYDSSGTSFLWPKISAKFQRGRQVG